MDSGLLQAVLAGVSAGSACSVCGASANSAFLSAYIITHKQITGPVLGFLAGKTAMTALLCGLSACFGRAILDSSGLAGRLDVYLLAQILVLGVTCVLIGRWIWCEVGCRAACPGCRTDAGHIEGRAGGAAALFVSGISCGATPCAPLLLVLSRAAASTLPLAAACGAAFSVTGFLSPVLVWLGVSRLLAKKMHREITQWIKWFQFGCYILLAAVTVYTIILYKL